MCVWESIDRPRLRTAAAKRLVPATCHPVTGFAYARKDTAMDRTLRRLFASSAIVAL